MTIPSNVWNNLMAFANVLPIQQNYEMRMETDSDGKMLYLGLTIRPNRPTDVPEWCIFKYEYNEFGYTSRCRKPDNDISFTYTWDDRATYFS